LSSRLPRKIIEQVRKAGLPVKGRHPFVPSLVKNQRGDLVIQKKAVTMGPKKGKRGYVDECGRIWIRDYAHGDVPDHWDVQVDDGAEYLRVDENGNEIP